MSVTLLEENIDHLTHGTTGLITWQVRYSKEDRDLLVVLYSVSKYVKLRSVVCCLQNVSGMVWLTFPSAKQEGSFFSLHSLNTMFSDCQLRGDIASPDEYILLFCICAAGFFNFAGYLVEVKFSSGFFENTY